MNKKKDHLVLDLDSMSANAHGDTKHIKTHISCDRKTELIQEYNSCVLCDSELLFVHLTDFSDDVVFEESTCSNCNIKSQKKAHRLQ